MENKGIAISYCINIPEDATNGDVIKAVYPKGKVRHEPSYTHDKMVFSFPDGTYFGAECRFNTEWWNAPYKAERDEVRTCANCKHYKHFGKEFPCIDCMMDCKDRFEEREEE